MTTFFVTFGVIVFLVLIMAIGVLFGRKPIQGSCGGYEALGTECAIGCKTPCEKRLARIRDQAIRDQNPSPGPCPPSPEP